jgi:hypothetical protein
MDCLCDENVMYEKFLFFDDEQIEFFEKALKKNGHSMDGISLLDQIDSVLKLMPFISIFYSDNEYHLVVADEVRKVYSTMKKTNLASQRKAYVTVNALAEAASNLYGVLSVEDFQEIVKNYTNDKEADEQIRYMLSDLFYNKTDSEFELFDGNLVSAAIMEDEKYYSWIEEILHKRSIRPMKIIAAQDMVYYCSFQYIEMTNDHKRLLAFLKNNVPEGENEGVAEQLLEDLNISFRYDEEIHAIMEEINKAGYIFDIDKMNIMLGLVMAARNNTRIWGLNGWTPEELTKNEAPIRKLAAEKAKESGMEPWKPEEFVEPGQTPYVNASPKIGRNEPCPCGSGKKYKNCCLLKDS